MGRRAAVAATGATGLGAVLAAALLVPALLLPGATAAAPATAATPSPASPPPLDPTTTTGATATGAEAVVVAGRRLVDPAEHGAVGDGTTDDTAALQRALDALRPGDVLVLPAGRTYAHTGVLRIGVDGTTVTGGGTLLATVPAASALWVVGDDVTLSGVVVETRATERLGTWEDVGIRLAGTSGTVLSGVTVRGSASAGVLVEGSDGFLLDGVTVEDTLADGIHVTGGSHDGRVVGAVVRRSGDDGIAVVTYDDAPPVSDVTITSPVVEGTTWGRGLSVVGGTRITLTDVSVHDSDAAGIYVASEPGWDTLAATGVVVDGGEVVGANAGTANDHGAVAIYSGDPTRPVRDVRMSDLVISGTGPGASQEVALLGAPSTGVVLERFSIDPAGVGASGRALFVTASGSRAELTGWTRGGSPVADVRR